VNPRRAFLDMACAEIGAAFRVGPASRRAVHAPLLRGAALYFEDTKPAFYALEQYHDLWQELRRTDELVTWSGERLGLLVSG
jgi:hypothetical protein